MIIITKEFIEEHTKNKNTNGINASQCLILGFKFKDLKKGWKDRAKDKVISNASAELFKRLKGVVGKRNQQLIIDDFKKDRR